MALKLSATQQAQLAFLNSLPPKIQRVGHVVEQMAVGQADEAHVRGMIRTLDEMKAGASQLKVNNLADATGQMAAMARRGGGLQVKVRGLRDLLGSVKMNYEMALRRASVPEGASETEPPGS